MMLKRLQRLNRYDGALDAAVDAAGNAIEFIAHGYRNSTRCVAAGRKNAMGVFGMISDSTSQLLDESRAERQSP